MKQWHWDLFYRFVYRALGKGSLEKVMQHQTWSLGWMKLCLASDLTWGWEKRAGTVKLPLSSVRLQHSKLPWQSAATGGQCLCQIFSFLPISAAWCWERDKWAFTLLPAQPCCPCAGIFTGQLLQLPVLYTTTVFTESPLDTHNFH